MIESLADVKNNRGYLLWLLALLVIGILTFSINMYSFPYYESDEGTYMSQAWSLITQGKLAPYNYTYDHAPLGWMLIALWTTITGGIYTFGFSINSGRTFMLLIHLLTILFIYIIAFRITKNVKASAFSTLLYTVSPLVIYYSRRVLLDNIMTFWLLLSSYLIIRNPNAYKNITVSGLLFGLALLTKESALVFTPIFLYVIFVFNKNLGDQIKKILIWLFSVFIVVIWYPLYAFSRGELFTNGDEVTLVGTFLMQMGRGGYNIFDFENNRFLILFKEWFETDPFIIVGGIIATFVCLYFGIKDYSARVLGLLSLGYLLFLARGGLVLEFYILPLLPFFVICIAFVINRLIIKSTKLSIPLYILLIAVSLISLFYYSAQVKDNRNIYFSNQTMSQIEAVNWVRQNTSINARGATDNYAYIELNDDSVVGDRLFENYWKAEKDPTVRDQSFSSDPANVSYLVWSRQMETDVLETSNFPFMKQVFDKTVGVIKFSQDGWFVEIRRQLPDRALFPL